MSFVETIARKRDGQALSRADVNAFITGLSDGSVGLEQAAALLMAFCLRGATAAERQYLVEAMRDSGEVWRLGEAVPTAVDKHSTGGVGDTVSLVLAPWLAACGIPVAMMAGAGLGHSQGTLDKLSALPGFRPAADREQALELLDSCGCCFAAQSQRIAPADRVLYALRDVTATVPSLPLIVASIMSKKLAVGAANLVLDVKWGRGAFRKSLEEARELAEALVAVAQEAGVRVRALITDMNQPLGRHLGCANEVRAALEILNGRGDFRLRAVTRELALESLILAAREPSEAGAELDRVLADGTALSAWNALVVAHGGNPDPDILPIPRRHVPVTAVSSGYLAAIDSESLGWAAVALGAGRRRLDDTIDLAAGLSVHCRVGDAVQVGQPLATLEIGQRPVDQDALQQRVRTAMTVTPEPPSPPQPLVVARLGRSS